MSAISDFLQSTPDNPPRIAVLHWHGEDVYGVLNTDDAELYNIRVIDFIPTPSPEHGFGGVEMVLAPTIVQFEPDDDSITWRELTADEFWSLARAKAKEQS